MISALQTTPEALLTADAAPIARPARLEATNLTTPAGLVEVASHFALVKPQDAARAERWLLATGSTIVRRSPSGFWRVTRPEAMPLPSFLRALERSAAFDAVQPEGIVRAASLADGNTPYRQYQWNLDQLALDDALAEGDVTLQDLAAVTVAVIDSGVAYLATTHNGLSHVKATDLDGSTIIPGHDYVDNDALPLDLSGHGTHIANIIAADGKTLGVAPHVSLLPIRVLDGSNMGLELDLADAILEATAEGVDVINLSLSFGVGYTPGAALASAVQQAADQDITVVASSGNSGEDQVGYPAAYASALAVGASRLTNGVMSWVADYSNTGSALDVVAPGGVSNLDVNDDGKPDGIAAQTIAPGNPSEVHYYLMAGTSQAAAHVAGAAAWLRAAGADRAEIAQALINTSRGVWGRRFFYSRQGIGMVHLRDAVDAFVHDRPFVNDEARYYVNVLPVMFESDGRAAAVGMIQVINGQGQPAANVMVAGHWVGSSNATFGVITNNQGQATVATLAEHSAMTASAPALFALQVDRIVERGGRRVAPTPLSFYYASNGLRQAIFSWYRTPAVQNSRLMFKLEPGVNAMPTWILTQYLSKPVAALDGLAPLALVFNQAYLDALVPNHSQLMTTHDVSLGSSYAFGWGSASSAPIQVGENMPTIHGGSLSLAIGAFDPSIYWRQLTGVVPVVNASSETTLSRNQELYGNLASGVPGYGQGIPLVVVGGDGIPLVVVGGDGIPLVVVGGDGIPLAVLGGDGIPSVVLGADGIPLVVVGGDGIPLVVVGGDGIPTVVLDADSESAALMSASGGSGSYAPELETELMGSSASVPVLVASSYEDSSGAGPIEITVPGFVSSEDPILLTPDE